jgi:polyhydroxyalkanoate synthesis regulator phasin
MKRLLALITALAISATLGVAAPAVAAPKAGPSSKGMSESGKDQAFSSLLDQLVAKGTITVAQATAIVEAMKAKKAERHAKMEAFAAKADVIIAGVLGLSVEKFKEARATRSLPAPTAEQKSQIRSKLDALAVSMGLPKAPKHGKGPHKD